MSYSEQQKSVMVPDPFDHPGPDGDWLEWELKPKSGWPRIELPVILEKEVDRYLETIGQEAASPEIGREFCDFLINRLVPSLKFYLHSFRDKILTKIESSPAYARSVEQEGRLADFFWKSDSKAFEGKAPSLEEGYILLWSNFFAKRIRPLLDGETKN